MIEGNDDSLLLRRLVCAWQLTCCTVDTHSIKDLVVREEPHKVSGVGDIAAWLTNGSYTLSLSVCAHVRTKKLIVDVVRIQPGETLPEILETPATAPQVTFSYQLYPTALAIKETYAIKVWSLFAAVFTNLCKSHVTFHLKELEHTKIIERRAVQDAQTPEGLKSSLAVLEDSQLPLEQKKRKILRNLRNLEQAGLATAANKYQDLINDISKVRKLLLNCFHRRVCSASESVKTKHCNWQDIRYQRRYRQRRKAELVKLQQTLTALNSKTAFYQDQMNYYDTYIKTCLDNLNRKWVGL